MAWISSDSSATRTTRRSSSSQDTATFRRRFARSKPAPSTFWRNHSASRTSWRRSTRPSRATDTRGWREPRRARLQQRYSSLTPRESQVLPLIVSGLLNKQAAAELGISEVTLQIHRSRIMQKMAAESFADLVRMAGQLNIALERRKQQ